MASGSLNFRLQHAEAVHHFIYAELSRFGVNKCKKYRGRLEEEGNIKEERRTTCLVDHRDYENRGRKERWRSGGGRGQTCMVMSLAPMTTRVPKSKTDWQQWQVHKRDVRAVDPHATKLGLHRPAPLKTLTFSAASALRPSKPSPP